MTALETAAIAALKAIIEEVAGHGQPFSADSYLPAHLIHDARAVIEQAAGEEAKSAADYLIRKIEAADKKDVDELRRLNGFKP